MMPRASRSGRRRKTRRPGRSIANLWLDDFAGKLGDDYTRRNRTGDQTAFFAPIVTLTGPLESAIEFGPNVGLNLSALRRIFPQIEVAGVEVNQGACAEQIQ